MHENSAALAQYTEIRDTQEQKMEELMQMMEDCQIDKDLLLNLAEEEEIMIPLPSSLAGFGKLRFGFNQ
jgi:hypothetical protein